MTKKFENLRDEIQVKRGEIYTNQLNMSVGELINLYENKEIELEPAFQRLFRWDTNQETNFIESILLGYPIPAIFVLQRNDGVWDVIDGVQRLSSIYHFVGVLKDKDNLDVKPLKLESARILENLRGKYFMSENEDSFDTSSRIDFKRASLPVIILKDGSEEKSKYELFKRLNTGGSHLSKQEIRNALILMYDESIFNAMNNYAESEKFVNMINLSENSSELRRDLDILTRFLVMRKFKNIESIPKDVDINEFLDDAIEDVISSKGFNIYDELAVFDTLISFLSEHFSDDYGFKVYDNKDKRFKGAFNWLVFETLIWGCTVLNDVKELQKNPEFYIERIKQLESIGTYKQRMGKTNIRVIERLKGAKEEAKRIFCNE